MIKILREPRRRNTFPAARRMARFAGLFERAMVDIRMAVGAMAKSKSSVTRLSVRARRVAFLACHLEMHPGERIPRLRVVEFLNGGDGFPIRGVMALLASRAKPALMGILVARATSLGEAQEGPVQVLVFDLRAIGGRNVLRVVAAIACQTRVLSLKRISSLLVIKGTGIPFDDREIFPVMVRMAAHATLTRTRWKTIGRVESAMRSDAPGNLCVTFKTLERGLSGGKLVAGRAVRCPVE